MEQKSKTSLIIIIILIYLIAVFAGIIAIFEIRNHKKEVAENATSQITSEVQESFVSNSELEALLSNQPMAVTETKYYYGNASKQLKYDAMGATVINNSDVEIKSCVVAFCAFDEYDNPIKIKQPGDSTDGAYIRTVTVDFTKEGKALAPGESYDDIVFYVSDEPQIVTIKPCVKSYISTDDITWENPHYKNFKNNYSSRTLTYGDNF